MQTAAAKKERKQNLHKQYNINRANSSGDLGGPLGGPLDITVGPLDITVGP